MKYERQLVLREWGSSGQAALEASHARLPCQGTALAVAERYLHAAGIADVAAAEVGSSRGPLAEAVIGLPWHSTRARDVGLGAACAVDFLAMTLREVRP
jgi:hypothetical protein